MILDILQLWNKGRIQPCQLPDESLYPNPPSVGLVIGTFAAVPYIHLQLEARRRFYPQIPLLVHDDASRRREELHDLCNTYGADFASTSSRQLIGNGDIAAMAGGLWWARAGSLDVLLKVSRRWIFRADWRQNLIDLAFQSQYATFSSFTTTYNFGFRTECVGFSVNAWTIPAIFGELLEPIRHQRTVFVEGFIHGLARRLEATQSASAEKWRTAHPMPPEKNGYALWPFMGTDRCQRSATFLWHNCNQPKDYYRTSREWGLPYTQSDFLDANQGEGDGR